MLALHTPQFCCGGLNFGSFYDQSPIIAYDGETAPPYTMADFTPSTVPGCRTPHLWLRDGRSLYDALGTGYTLLRFDRSADVDTVVSAATAFPVMCRYLSWMWKARSTYDGYALTSSVIPPRPARRLARQRRA